MRVLLETSVNFFYFLRSDAKEMTQQYVDASILDKLKYLRRVDFFRGTAAAALHDQAAWEKTEKEIEGRYDAKKLGAIRKNGFTGLNFEQRAKAVGFQTMYDHCYRIASRSVHMFDPAETPLYSLAYEGRTREKRELLKLRRDQLETNQNMLLGRASYVIAIMVKNRLASLKLMGLGLGYEKYRDKSSGKPPSVTKGERGQFYVWRE